MASDPQHPHTPDGRSPWAPNTGPTAPGGHGPGGAHAYTGEDDTATSITPAVRPGDYPQSQPSAGYPQSQPSAGYPQGQPSAGYPYDPSSGYSQSQAAPGYPPAGYGGQFGSASYPDQGQPAGGWTSGTAQPSDTGRPAGRPGLVARMFDLSFTTFVTPQLARVLWFVAIAVALVWFVGGVASSFDAFGLSVRSIWTLLTGWIPGVLLLLVVRVGLDWVMASIRTADDVRALRKRQDSGTSTD